MSEKFVIFGWPGCSYAQKARKHAEELGVDYIFVDTSNSVPDFIRQLPTYGSSPGQWQSPHILRYIGGASEFSGAGGSHAGCKRTLDGIIC